MGLGWKFPLTGGGSESGHKHSGISHFTGDRISSLAREIIQNSLDARARPLLKDKAVEVKFNIKPIQTEEFPGHRQLLDIFKRCVKRCEDENAETQVLNFYENGVKILSGQQIRLLQISDYNTTGLTDNPDSFHKLVKAQEDSNKDAQAGGSYGIGKFAPYAVSDLRTVFYSTMYHNGKANVNRAQGRSVLMTHRNSKGEKTQGIGFYGDNTDTECNPIPTKDIPAFLDRDAVGTTVSVASFQSYTTDWVKRLAKSVVANFFVAIQEGKLEVSIDDKLHITSSSLPTYFELLCTEEQDEDSDIWIARYMYEAQQSGQEIDFQLSGLGHCKLWVLAREKLPKVVGMVRGTGMLISKELPKLKNFGVGFGDFVAIIHCLSPDGNALLRSMENPRHNAFEPDNIEGSEKERERGAKALQELGDSVRNKIKSIVFPEQGKSVKIQEMARFFADPDDTSGDDGDAEYDFEKGIEITRKPIRRQKSIAVKVEEEGDDDEGGGDERERGEGSGRGRGGRRSGRGGGGSGNRRAIAVQNVRVVRNANDRGKYEVAFTPKESGKVNLLFRIAGDQRVDDLPLSPECKERARGIEVVKDQRFSFVIESDEEINAAIRVDVYEDTTESSANDGEKQ